MKSARPKTPARKPFLQPKGSNTLSKDPVRVYCRLRPMHSSRDVSCIRVTSDTTLVITSPVSAENNRANTKETEMIFSRVFKPDVTQSEVFKIVALPLVENLVQGKNGLLFTYGVTGSGKTYTMTGDSKKKGIVPRCLDVIFNTIGNYQTKKFVFKPDRLNGFDVQSERDAAADREQAIRLKEHELFTDLQKMGKPKHLKKDSDGDSNPAEYNECNESQKQTVALDPDNGYAVFIHYVQIYNNFVYDLLDKDDIRTKTQSKLVIREDGNRNTYVHAVTEVEVKSAEEAFMLFQYGQRKRRIGETALNVESSRSHTVFTIRLVQAPLDCEGEYVMQDKRFICVSQLSLVDLAGSERTSRTKTTGQRLREAGNINNSLMALRTCLEILKENQSQNATKMVPYRDSKLTHLFKNYLEGEGQIRMMVCVNPRADDYDETIQVMQFAEMSQEVQTMRSNPIKLDLGLTPGRRQVNKQFKEIRKKFEHETRPEANLEIDYGLIYNMEEPFPEIESYTADNDQVTYSLIRFLEQRINKRNILRAELKKKQEAFREALVAIEQESRNLKSENNVLKAKGMQLEKRINALEGHICKTESQNNNLQRQLSDAKETIRNLRHDIKTRDSALNQREMDMQKVKQKCNAKIQAKTTKLKRELDLNQRQLCEQLQSQIKEKENRLQLVKQIIDNNGIPERIPTKRQDAEPGRRAISPDTATRISRKENRVPVSNPRYRRSQSADRWIDHRPQALVPIGTVLQPLMNRRRSVTRLTSPKEITDGASRYCLISQEHDTDGELETKLFKGDILPTSGGGAQVVFNDMECLKQSSPKARKRTGEERSEDQVDAATSTEVKRPRVISS